MAAPQRKPDDYDEWEEQARAPTPRRALVVADRRISLRLAIAAVIGILVIGLLAGEGLGSGDTPAAETVTQVRTVAHAVTQVKTKRVPVVKVRTVTQVKRVVHTQTVTVQAQPVAAPPSSGDSSRGGGDGADPAADYAGMNCSEIGHSFNVTPGSDPEHDADNDGVACESY
ncbi:MAG TPA: hypothetical protein VGM91_06055 [Conexibacter sp.]|jgi:hypothetical protein